MADTRDSTRDGDTATLASAAGARHSRRSVVASGIGAALFLAGAASPTRAFQDDEREVEDAFGTVIVPSRPERVIAVRHHDIGNMLALGVTPVGIVPDASEFPLPEQAAMLAGVANVRADTDWVLDIEKAMALKPDLILEMSGQEGDPWNEETCTLAREAVTTLCFPYGYTTDAEIKENMRHVGLALGLEDQARAAIAAYDARVAAVTAEIAEAGVGDLAVASVIWQGEGNFFVPIDRSPNLILRTLGIAQPSFQDDPNDSEVTLSFENASFLNEADAMIVLLEGAGTQAELEANPVWQLLDPVKSGQVLFLDANRWGWEYIPALMSMLDDVETQLVPLLSTKQTSS